MQAATEELLDCRKARDVAVAELDDLESKVPVVRLETACATAGASQQAA
jgi:hypothetical protein